MNFLFGIGFGVLGMWAYYGGKLDSLLNLAPAPIQQALHRSSERINEVTETDQFRQAVSTVQDKVQQAAAPQIAIPTAAEVAGRPSEPLPRYEPEGVHVENG